MGRRPLCREERVGEQYLWGSGGAASVWVSTLAGKGVDALRLRKVPQASWQGSRLRYALVHIVALQLHTTGHQVVNCRRDCLIEARLAVISNVCVTPVINKEEHHVRLGRCSAGRCSSCYTCKEDQRGYSLHFNPQMDSKDQCGALLQLAVRGTVQEGRVWVLCVAI